MRSLKGLLAVSGSIFLLSASTAVAALPTPVNGQITDDTQVNTQITDSVTKTNVKVLGNSSAYAIGADDCVSGAECTPYIGKPSSGNHIKELQEFLKGEGDYNGPVDGIFGPQTEAAIKLFQQKQGIIVDGVIGSQTLKELQDEGVWND